MPRESKGKAIRISAETYERLVKWGVPLEDTADMILRRVLDTAEGRPPLPPRTWLLRNIKLVLGSKLLFGPEVTALSTYMAEAVTKHLLGNWAPMANDDDDARGRRVRRRIKQAPEAQELISAAAEASEQYGDDDLEDWAGEHPVG